MVQILVLCFPFFVVFRDKLIFRDHICREFELHFCGTYMYMYIVARKLNFLQSYASRVYA
jgi:hypothetical protein